METLRCPTCLSMLLVLHQGEQRCPMCHTRFGPRTQPVVLGGNRANAATRARHLPIRGRAVGAVRDDARRGREAVAPSPAPANREDRPGVGGADLYVALRGGRTRRTAAENARAVRATPRAERRRLSGSGHSRRAPVGRRAARRCRLDHDGEAAPVPEPLAPASPPLLHRPEPTPVDSLHPLPAQPVSARVRWWQRLPLRWTIELVERPEPLAASDRQGPNRCSRNHALSKRPRHPRRRPRALGLLRSPPRPRAATAGAQPDVA